MGLVPRFSARFFKFLSCIAFAFVWLSPDLHCQSDPMADRGRENSAARDQDFSIKIGVEEVRLDATVVDRKGRQIRDLKAEDFEILQDGKRQRITDARYISSPSGLKMEAGPTPILSREEVRRTIVFIFDNLGMPMDHVDRGRMAIRDFVKTQMLPGDLVTIVPTAGGNAALQTFTSDKQQLLAMVDNVKWHLNSLSLGHATPQLLALSYCIRALREMPGRKHLLLISSQTDSPPISKPEVLPRPTEYLIRARMAGAPAEGALADQLAGAYKAFLRDVNEAHILWSKAMDGIAHESIRSGVVIHTLNTWGLDYTEVYDRHSKMTPLPKKTGGLFVANNFFLNGMSDVNEEMRGYYLLSYAPPAETIQPGKSFYHRIKIRVKRPGAVVHTRDGFHGGDEKQNVPAGSVNPLMAALFSPFKNRDLSVGMTAGYVRDSDAGYMVRSQLRFDARDVQIADENDSLHSFSFEVAGATVDINGDIQDSGKIQRSMKVNREEMELIRKHGINVSLSIPSKNPGSYFVRVAVRDKESGKTGSAYQFIQIPDLKKGHLSLSSIFTVEPDKQRRPAILSYRPGECIEYMTNIYNARASEGRSPDLESQIVLYRNGSEVHKSAFEPVKPGNRNVSDGIPVRKRLYLGEAMLPGSYSLRLSVRDKQAAKDNSADQTLEFEIVQ